MRFWLFVLILVSACSSQPIRVPQGASLSDAIRFAKEGKQEEARNALGIGCLAKDPAACHALGRNLPPLPKRLGILQGPTNEKSTTIAVHYVKSSLLTVLLWDPTETRLIVPTQEKDLNQEGSPWSVRQARFDTLQPDRPYMLQILDGENLLDARELWTLDANKPSVKFAAAACMDDKFMEVERGMWEGLISERPDFILFLGDNVYADRQGILPKPADAAQLWQRYSETRSSLTIFKQTRLIPIFATWDDHDYGTKDGDRTFEGQAASKETFLAFFPQSIAEGIVQTGPGIATTFSLRGQRFVLMDDRSFRSPSLLGKTETHWGLEQENWLFKSLAKGNLPAWIINGNQYFGKYTKFDSYEGKHPTSFQQWTGRMQKVRAPFVLISGDRHLTELMEITASEMGRKTYEITTSAIHAKTYPDAWKVEKNPRQIAGVTGVTNYVVVKSTAEKKRLKFHVTAFGPEKKILYEKDLTVVGR